MKKILCVFLSVLMAALLIVPAAAADAAKEDYNDYPVVIIPGYSSSQLYVVDPDGSKRDIWWVNYSAILETVKENLADLAKGLGSYGVGDAEKLREILKPLLELYVGELACNPDGTSKYDVHPVLELTAEGSRWSGLEEKHRRLVGYVDEIMDTDDIYMASSDFRMGAIYNANRLDTLIQDIIKTTGCKKVNILCQSHGGQVAGTYLSLHAKDAGKYVNNVVMCVPALGGAAMAYDALTEQVELDELSILKFFEYNQQMGTEFDWLLAAEPLGGVDNLIFALMPLVKEVVGYWPSLWDFVPMDYLDECIATLDPVASKKLIDDTTYFHNTIMAHYKENLQAAQKSGVNISILAGFGFDAVTGMDINSDGIIPVNAATGAICAPYGQRYNDGYTTKNTVCKNKNHNHLSPSMEIDASTCWLPENTWFIDGYYHGQERMDQKSMALIRRQLLSKDPVKDVHSDPAYPQFRSTGTETEGVHVMFDRSVEGYLSSQDTSLVVTNTTKYPVFVLSVETQGVDLSFNLPFGQFIGAGKSVSLPYEGEIPEISKTRAAVTVYFIEIGGSGTPILSRTTDFTIMNGEAPEYDKNNPYTDVDFPLGEIVTTPGVDNDMVTRALGVFGVSELYIRVYIFVTTAIDMIKRVVAMFQAISAMS
ncbi:MAG: hypothetical protein IJK23_03725 [Clostridia bacterium]|nr:hypothetical protein [Clostridia bacterium]